MKHRALADILALCLLFPALALRIPLDSFRPVKGAITFSERPYTSARP